VVVQALILVVWIYGALLLESKGNPQESSPYLRYPHSGSTRLKLSQYAILQKSINFAIITVLLDRTI
jgi:hypothetical protein